MFVQKCEKSTAWLCPRHNSSEPNLADAFVLIYKHLLGNIGALKVRRMVFFTPQIKKGDNACLIYASVCID